MGCSSQVHCLSGLNHVYIFNCQNPLQYIHLSLSLSLSLSHSLTHSHTHTHTHREREREQLVIKPEVFQGQGSRDEFRFWSRVGWGVMRKKGHHVAASGWRMSWGHRSCIHLRRAWSYWCTLFAQLLCPAGQRKAQVGRKAKEGITTSLWAIPPPAVPFVWWNAVASGKRYLAVLRELIQWAHQASPAAWQWTCCGTKSLCLYLY